MDWKARKCKKSVNSDFSNVYVAKSKEQNFTEKRDIFKLFLLLFFFTS